MPDDNAVVTEPAIISDAEFGAEERRKQPLLRLWVTWGPVITAFVAGMGLYDSTHARQWAFAAVVCAALSGGSKGPAILQGK